MSGNWCTGVAETTCDKAEKRREYVTRLNFTGRRLAKSDWLGVRYAVGKTCTFLLEREEQDTKTIA